MSELVYEARVERKGKGTRQQEDGTDSDWVREKKTKQSYWCCSACITTAPETQESSAHERDTSALSRHSIHRMLYIAPNLPWCAFICVHRVG